MARAQAGDLAAGAKTDVGPLRQPVGDAVEEYVAGVRYRRSGSRLQRNADECRNLSATGSVYDRGFDLLRDPVSSPVRWTQARAWRDLRQGLTGSKAASDIEFDRH